MRRIPRPTIAPSGESRRTVTYRVVVASHAPVATPGSMSLNPSKEKRRPSAVTSGSRYHMCRTAGSGSSGAKSWNWPPSTVSGSASTSGAMTAPTAVIGDARFSVSVRRSSEDRVSTNDIGDRAASPAAAACW